jgi:hypothetical protein
MNKPGIFAAIAVAIIGVIAILAASTAVPSAPSGAQVDPSSMMTQTHGLPSQRIADLSVVFVDPVGP